MKRPVQKIISFILVMALIFSLLMPVSAIPSAVEIITTPSGYTTAADVVYVTEGDIVLNWGARGEDCNFLTTYAQSYYTDGIGYDDLSQLSGGTGATDAPDSELYAALQELMVSRHTTFTKYGGSTALDCKKFYHYTDCMLSDPTYVSTLYRGTTVTGPWDGGKSYNQEHVWPQSKCIGTASQDVGDLMQLRPAVPNENSSRNNTAYGESDGYYDPGISVRGDCARTLLYVYTRWGNTEKLWGEEGVIENLEILLRWIEEDPVDTWEMGHNDAVQSITGVRNVFVDYPEYAWHLFGQPLPSDLQTPSDGESGDSGATQTATLVTDAGTLSAGDQIIIVAADYNLALSTEQKTSNRGQAAVTKDGTTVSFGSDAQILTLESGTVSGTFALNTGDGYLSAVSSSANYLKTNATLADNGSWSISIDTATGVASLTASGTYTRNTLRYNSTSSLFSCYVETTTQKEVSIYRLQTETPEDPGTSTTATLVTNASSLKTGDQILIVAADYDFALSTEQKTSNRGQAAVTKDGTTVTYDSDAQILTLESGTIGGTFALNTGDGYLSATSSSANNLKTNATLADNGSWSISIDSTTGVASLTAGGTYTRNTLRYNSTSSLFSCYVETTTQKEVMIYRLGAPTEKVIYFRNTAGWSAPYIYAWNDNATITSGWPGDAMTKVPGSTNIYRYPLSNEATSVIFTNNGASQTADLTIPTDGADLYTMSTGSWSKYDPAATDYYLVGYINGTNYGCEENSADLGRYKFVDGKLTATFTADSYVFVKTGDNANWYLCESYTQAPPATLVLNASEKLLVPGKAQISFTLTVNDSGTLTLDYTLSDCPHEYTGVVTKAATCTATGTKEYTCAICGNSYTETIAALGHSYSYQVTDPSCTAQGYTTYTCTSCGSSYTDDYTAATGHSYSGTGVCTKCGTGCTHSYSSKVTQTATCTATGIRKYTCATCGHSYTETIAALGHSYVTKVTAPTCTVNGYTSYTCSSCGNYYTDNITAATGHSYSSSGVCTGCGSGCLHDYTYEVTKSPTCTATGIREYTCATCAHRYTEPIPALGHDYHYEVVAPTCTAQGYTRFTCFTCGSTYTDDTTPATGHSYSTDGICTACGVGCSHNYSNKVTQPATCTVPGTRQYTCSICGISHSESITPLGHSYTARVTDPTCTTQGYTTFTCATCGHSYTGNTISATGHDYASNGSCTRCGIGCPHEYASTVTKAPTCSATGTRKYTCAICAHSYTETVAVLAHSYTSQKTAPTCTVPGSILYVCDNCGYNYSEKLPATGHEYSGGYCLNCGASDGTTLEYYLFGYINGANYGCEEDASTLGEYRFVNGKVSVFFEADSYIGVKEVIAGVDYVAEVATWYMTDDYQGQVTSTTMYASTTLARPDKLFIPGNVDVTITIVKNDDGTLSVSYTTYECPHEYTCEVTKDATCTAEGQRTYTCALCGDSYTERIPATGHTYSGGYCLVCGASDGTPVDFYLFGYINGANYACEEDWQHLGQYKFVDGKLTATFLTESYVAVKTGDNINWFMSNSYIQTTSGTFYHTSTGASEKMRIPGGVEVTFTLVQNKDGSVDLSYTTEPITVTDPGLTLSYPTLSFEDEIIYNVYYSVKDTASVVEMGLMILPMMDQTATVEDATALVPGHVTNGTVYLAKSRGIPAANMGDTVYFKVYAKLADGSYAYSSAGGYNAKAYARSILNGNNSTEMKSLVVSMLNYGAEAQLFFGHDTGSLVNDGLTDDQKALVNNYDSTMMDAIVKADNTKTGDFVRVNSNFKSLYPSVSFDGAFSINFYCSPAITVDSDMTLFFWDMETMASVEKLSIDNATGSMVMEPTNSMYWGQVAGIAAKQMDKTYYVTCVFESNGQTITTGIIPYSLGKYCSDKAAADGDAQQAFAQAAAVYGYYAKNYFASIA